MIRGVINLLEGLHLLLGQPALRKILWRMLGLLAVLMMVLTVGVFWLSDYLAHLWIPRIDTWYWQVLGAVAWLLAFVLALVSGVLGFTVLASIATSPWLDMLASRAEALAGGNVRENPASWMSQIAQSLSNTVRPLLGLLGLGFLAALCLMIPVIGQIAATMIWSYAGIRFLNFEMMDIVASRHQWRYSQRRSELSNQRLYYLGFGGTAMLLMMIPVLNILVLPAAVVALSYRYVQAS